MPFVKYTIPLTQIKGQMHKAAVYSLLLELNWRLLKLNYFELYCQFIFTQPAENIIDKV